MHDGHVLGAVPVRLLQRLRLVAHAFLGQRPRLTDDAHVGQALLHDDGAAFAVGDDVHKVNVPVANLLRGPFRLTRHAAQCLATSGFAAQ